MEDLVQRLRALRSTTEKMCSLTGTAGLTYGVIYHGQIVHTENFGYRDAENKLPVNEDIIFNVGSLTKNMIAAIVGMLVEEGKLRWDTPIKDILSDWDVQDPTMCEQATIVDCLAHRTGLQMNNYYLASNNNIIIPPKHSMKLINSLKAIRQFRGQWQYHNLG